MDDILVLCTGRKPVDLCANICCYLDELAAWLEGRNLSLSAGKSSASLFTTWTKEVGRQLPVAIAGAPVPSSNGLKVLRITFDPTMTFSCHANIIGTKVSQCLNILKQLDGSDWGCT